MVVETDILKTYAKSIQQSGRNTQSAPPKPAYNQGGKQPVKPIDPKIQSDMFIVRDSFDKFRNSTQYLKSQINELDNKAHKNKELIKSVFATFSPIAPIRRISSLQDNVDDGNYTRAVGLIGLMVVNLPEDCRDVRNGIRQVLDKILPNNVKEFVKIRYPKIYKHLVEFNPSYDYSKLQHPFSFFRGTLLEPLINLPNEWGTLISAKLHKADRPLNDTRLGQKFLKTLKIKTGEFRETNISNIHDDFILAKAFKGGNRFTRLIAESMLRIPALGVYALSILELPAIIKSFKKGKNTKEKTIFVLKQIAKSSIFVSFMISGIGIFGRLGAKKGPMGSLIGMGIGSVIGGFISKKAGKFIDGK